MDKRNNGKNRALVPLEDINLGPFKIAGPTKARVSGKFIPDFTIDLSKPSKGPGILSLIDPKITFLIGSNAFQLQMGKGNLKQVNSDIFNQPTLFDTLNKIGIIPILFVISTIGFVVYRLIRRK